MTCDADDAPVLPPPEARTPAYYATLTPEQRVALIPVLTREAWERSGRTWPPPSTPRSQWPVRVITRAQHDAEESLEEFLEGPVDC